MSIGREVDMLPALFALEQPEHCELTQFALNRTDLGAHRTLDLPPIPVAQAATATDRIAALEEVVQELRNVVADLRAQLATFGKQFE